jgi:methylated-DNA-protein-cysteine methyltransferase-like protein
MQRVPEESFYQKVYFVVRQIPRGKVSTYGAIAKYLGTGLSARMVGWALNSCHGINPPVPAQRVVNRNGLLTGAIHFPTPTLMQELLIAEGIPVENNCIRHFRNYFWDPMEELELLPPL